ncbi:hypothetical protein Zmor_021237 [Zophobas morio]|uniref:Uncharacterized protein n=1 Tax=Zophobas morio TaxID=2755281 RepID=A0AA38I7V8_9CUCU|nr:hypothetical protein Zmor_021237 [Zophobas morio]
MTHQELEVALSELHYEGEPFDPSDDDDYIPGAGTSENEESDAEKEPMLKKEEEYDSNITDDEEDATVPPSNLIGKDGTQWYSVSFELFSLLTIQQTT